MVSIDAKGGCGGAICLQSGDGIDILVFASLSGTTAGN